MPKQSFLGTAGLKDDFDYTITSAQFTFDAEYNDGKTCVLVLEGTDEDGEDERILLSTGSGWEPADKGARAVLESTGEPKEGGFNRSSRIHQFLVQACQAGAEETLESRGEAYDAGIWEGLTFHMQRGAIVKGEFEAGALPKNPTTGQEKTAGDLFPTEFKGEGGGTKKAGAAKKVGGAKKATAASKKEEDEGGDAAGEEAVDKVTLVKLKKIAKEVGEEDHDGFIERAMSEIDAVAESDEYQALIVDEAFFAGLF